MKRTERAAVARDTVAVLERGTYAPAGGGVTDVGPAVAACVAATRFYDPDAVTRTITEVLGREPGTTPATIEVRNETALAALARLVPGTADPIGVLNFASAKNPGGGFLSGSQAQEESLARSSALTASLSAAPSFYARHRADPSCLYSDAAIVSPNCPVFRDDNGELFAPPLAATFITCAAPNAGAVAANRSADLPLIPDVFRRRTAGVLALAAVHGCDTLVLGAWGCGVFRNDPAVVAAVFAEHLAPGGPWRGRFRHVAFAVLDAPDGPAITAFQGVVRSG